MLWTLQNRGKTCCRPLTPLFKKWGQGAAACFGMFCRVQHVQHVWVCSMYVQAFIFCEHRSNMIKTRCEHAETCWTRWTCLNMKCRNETWSEKYLPFLQSIACLACSGLVNMPWTSWEHAEHAEHERTWANMKSFFEHEKKIFEHALCLKR